MKSLVTLLATVAFAGAAFAGPVSYKSPKGPIMPPPPPPGCDCFAPGLAFGVFGGALINGDTDFGGGILAEYAFSPFVAIQTSYGLYATDKEHHNFDAALVLRYPITSICIAPYALAGGGFSTNSDSAGHVLVGGGLDFRIPTSSCISIFADGTYNFAGGGVGDFTLVRLGVKFPF